MSGRRPRAILFRVRGDVLYVANFGRRFDRAGVISVCRENLSPKSDRGPSEMLDDVPDRRLVDEIREKALAVYRLDGNRLQEDANHEDETRRDYAGRSLWELLQNADDALASPGTSSADLIGAKGLGFKSVLEITDRPSIHSGPFDFGFDADTSERLLATIQSDPPRLTFRLPHRMKRDGDVSALFDQGYSTVVRLPFQSRKVGQELTERLCELDPHFLLLCRNLDTVLIDLPDGTRRRLSVARRREVMLRNSPATLTIDERGESRSTEWRIWSSVAPAPDDRAKSLSAALAVQVVDGIPCPAPSELPIHVFFPTAEMVAARFLLHGSFSLTSNRNSIRVDQHDELVRGELQRLVRQAVDDMPATSVVQVFADVVRTAGARRAKRPDRVIAQMIATTVTEAEFVPVIGRGRRRAAEIRIWDHGLDQVVPRRLAKELALAGSEVAPVFPELRSVFGAQPLRPADYAAVLQGLRPASVDQALSCLRIASAACLSQTQQPQIVDHIGAASIWPCDDGRIRSLHASSPLLRERPADWPGWLPADTLHPEAAAIVEGEQGAQARWAPLSRRILRRPEEWLRSALAPTLAGWSEADWLRDGYEALQLISAWADIPDFHHAAPFVEKLGDTSLRAALARVAWVPCGKTWGAAVNAYAGRDLGAPPELSAYFKSVAGRHVVGMPARAKAIFGARPWKALLRWLGVSWEPKVVLVGRDGWLQGQASHLTFRQALQDPGLLHVNQEWYIEHFPAALEQLGPSQVASCVVALATATATAGLTGQWRKMSNAERLHAPMPFRCFADFQLRRERYLPQRSHGGRRLPRLAPHELFWPEKGLAGVTPILDLGTNNKLTRSGLKAVFVDRLQVHTSLPKEWPTWCSWSDELAARVRGGDLPAIKSLRGFYDALLNTFERPGGAKITEVVAQLPGQNPSVVVARAEETLWIDQGRFENPEILAGLGQLGRPILPVRLERGNGAVGVLGVRRASEVLAILPTFEAAPERRTREIERRVERRRGALAAISATKNQPLRALPRFRAVQDLRLRISIDGQPLADRLSPVYFDGSVWLVNLQASDVWEAVAIALSDQFGGHAPDLKYRFARILKAGPGEVRTILAEDGIPEYRIREAMRELDDELRPQADVPDGDREREQDASRPDDQDGMEDGGPAGLDSEGDDEEDEASESESYEADRDPDPRHDENGSGEPDGGGDGQSGGGRSEGGGKDEGGPNGGRRRLTRRKLYGGRGGGDRDRRNRRTAAEAAKAASERGLRAEAWLMRQVVENLSSGWECLANVRDDELRETDLVLSRRGEEWHIEIKCLTTERIYWSELEREKAERLPGRYLMALLLESSNGHYSVYWSWDPLRDLERCGRRIEWLWQASSEGPSIRDGWRLDPGFRWPERPADRYAHAIQVTEDDLESLPADGPGLDLLRAKVGDLDHGERRPSAAA